MLLVLVISLLWNTVLGGVHRAPPSTTVHVDGRFVVDRKVCEVGLGRNTAVPESIFMKKLTRYVGGETLFPVRVENSNEGLGIKLPFLDAGIYQPEIPCTPYHDGIRMRVTKAVGEHIKVEHFKIKANSIIDDSTGVIKYRMWAMKKEVLQKLKGVLVVVVHPVRSPSWKYSYEEIRKGHLYQIMPLYKNEEYLNDRHFEYTYQLESYRSGEGYYVSLYGFEVKEGENREEETREYLNTMSPVVGTEVNPIELSNAVLLATSNLMKVKTIGNKGGVKVPFGCSTSITHCVVNQNDHLAFPVNMIPSSVASNFSSMFEQHDGVMAPTKFNAVFEEDRVIAKVPEMLTSDIYTAQIVRSNNKVVGRQKFSLVKSLVMHPSQGWIQSYEAPLKVTFPYTPTNHRLMSFHLYFDNGGDTGYALAMTEFKLCNQSNYTLNNGIMTVMLRMGQVHPDLLDGRLHFYLVIKAGVSDSQEKIISISDLFGLRQSIHQSFAFAPHLRRIYLHSALLLSTRPSPRNPLKYCHFDNDLYVELSEDHMAMGGYMKVIGVNEIDREIEDNIRFNLSEISSQSNVSLLSGFTPPPTID